MCKLILVSEKVTNQACKTPNDNKHNNIHQFENLTTKVLSDSSIPTDKKYPVPNRQIKTVEARTKKPIRLVKFVGAMLSFVLSS